ncbi:MAG TPA: EAL domain-containing protein [Rhodobacterales bacterium]|nr:EAL domain-containing protein [Rhodobacterales bacterium]
MRQNNTPKPVVEGTNPLSAAISSRDSDVVSMVRTAVEHRWVRLAYQMVVSAAAPDRPVYFESLIRVLDNTGRIIPARDFMPVIEDNELGRQLDVLALENALDILGQHPRMRLSVNMSARSAGYYPWKEALLNGLKRDGTIAERLILEVAEKDTYTIPELVQSLMEELHLLGVSFALDNFGQGLTSLRHLRDLYFDIIKIDGIFTRELAGNPDNQAMTGAILALSHSLETYVIAQNVETAEDANALIQLGVDGMQGYYFGAPTLEPAWLEEGVSCRIA